ncbi:hypothetical protein AB0467_22085, partial [Streptomyces sp. NPDC052095]
MPVNVEEPGATGIGGYAVLGRLGSGGMGAAYLAQSSSGRRVAVKVVHACYAQDEDFRIRFRQEFAAACRVSGVFTAPSWTPCHRAVLVGAGSCPCGCGCSRRCTRPAARGVRACRPAGEIGLYQVGWR